MENARVADVIDEIGDLLELKGDNPFRVRSYRDAAQSIRNLSERLEDFDRDRHSFGDIPNVGESIAAKIEEILQRGTCKRLEELRSEVPAGLTAMMDVPGLGPKKVMQLHKELGIDSLEGLKKAAEEHRIRGMEGMGEKTESAILKGIATVEKTAGRLLYHEAAEQLDALAGHLDGVKAVKRWEVAGSFRRGKETIGDLDVLIHAEDRARATEALLQADAIKRVVGKGGEKVSVVLASGLQVDFRFFEPDRFGAAWMYFTGSKSHNIRLRRMAQDNDWKLNEYGLFKDDHLLAGKTEEAVYQRLNLDWVPPELREDRGEVQAAADGALPRLIEAGDVHGDFQCHTTASDGKHTIRKMAEAARDYGHDFLAITDHSKRVTMANGLDDDAARRHADAIREADGDLKRFWLLAGIEVDILKSGKLDLEEETLEELDWVVASIHYDRAMTRKAMTDRLIAAIESGVVHCIGHPLGRIIGKRDPLDIDMERFVGACVENDVWIEINGQPDRLDLPDIHAHHAREAGATFVLSTDAHSTDGFHLMPLAVNVARRAWLTKKDVINTSTITALKKRLKRQ